jgi:hypothetical protein
MPTSIFPELILKSLDSTLTFISLAGSSLVSNAFLAQTVRFVGRQVGIQQLLIPHLFNEDPVIREKSTLVLLESWLLFPANAVDPNPTGIMYAIVYTLTWIFEALESNGPVSSMVNSADLV